MARLETALLAFRQGASPGPPPYLLSGVQFDGVSNFLYRNNTLDNTPDSYIGMLSMWIYIDTTVAYGPTDGIFGTVNRRVLLSAVTNAGPAFLNFQLSDNSGNTLIAQSVAGSLPSLTWCHVLVSWNLNAPAGQKQVAIYINGVSQIGTVTDNSPAFPVAYYTGGYYLNAWRFGGGIGQAIKASFGDFMMWANYEIAQPGNLINPGDLSNFLNAGAPMSPSTLVNAYGRTTIHFGGNAASFPTNRGVGGPFGSFSNLPLADTTLYSTPLDFDFLGNSLYQATAATTTLGLTTTRASVGYIDDTSGNWTQVAANTARISNKGLLVEEQRTNSIRNSAAQGAVVGTPGTLPTNWVGSGGSGIVPQVVSTGVENGMDYIDIRFAGGAGNTNIFFDSNTNPGAAAVAGQTWSGSYFYRMIGGSTTNVGGMQLLVNEYNNTGVQQVPHQNAFAAPVPGAPYQRIALIGGGYLLTGGTTAFVNLAVQVQGSGPIDITLRFAWPQLEQGSFVTSPIRTTTVAVTRNADVITVTTPPAFGSAYTLFGSGTPLANAGSASNQVNFEGYIDGNNRATLFRTNTLGNAGAANIVAAGTPYNVVGASWGTGTAGKIAGAFTSGDQSSMFNGTQIGPAGAAAAFMAPTALNIGSRQGGTAQWNGYITRVAVWPSQRLSNATLQSLTAAGTPPAGALIAGGSMAWRDWDFVNQIYYQAGLTVTRNSVAYVDDLSGNWYAVAANAPRLSNKGLLVEEQRINGLRNNSMQGAVAGTPGTLPTNWVVSSTDGLSQQIVGIGTESGIDYIDIRLFGTATLGTHSYQIEGNTLNPATNGQNWAMSLFVKLAAGSLTNLGSFAIVVTQLDTGFVNLGDLVTQIPLPLIGSGALGAQRFANLVTTTQATIAYVRPSFRLNFTAGPVDVTVRIGWPQLEQGAWATSPIRTTSAAVTRAADSVVVTSPPTFASGAYTLFASGAPNAPNSNSFAQIIMEASVAGDANNRSSMDRNAAVSGTSPHVLANVGGTAMININITAGAPWQQSTLGKLALVCRAGDYAGCYNGSAIVATSGANTITPNRIDLGARFNGSFSFDGYVTRATIWPNQRLPNGTLQALTAIT